jgi:outer membrane protein assembly factor BamE (lipoprotein component of BamABCDE complex)
MKNIECLLLLLIVTALAGCGTTQTTGRDFDAAKIHDIKKGVTTGDELVRLLGQPLSKSNESANGAVWEYSWKKATAYATTSSAGTVIKTEGDLKTLTVLIKNGVVVSYTFKDDPFWDEKLNGSQ